VAESIVQVTEGVGKKLHTNSYTVGANTVEDEFSVPGPYPYATYSITSAFSGVTTATSGDDIFQIMAGASLKVRIVAIDVYGTTITAAAELSWTVMRLTSAGTAGTAITPRPFDSADAAAGATAAVGVPNATHGTAGVTLDFGRVWPPQTVGAGGQSGSVSWSWREDPNSKPLIIPAGTTNGIALRVNTGRAGSIVVCSARFVETAF
jgi:hypothetical protein